jgi:hypothetical protein
MKKIQLCLASLLISTAGYAVQPCDGFQIVVKNNTPDKFYATTVELNGANIQPKLIEVNGNAEVSFTVNNSEDTPSLNGEMVFRTFSLPSKKVHIAFDLKNQTLICEHTNKEQPSDYSITSLRLPGKVTYNIG